MDVSEFERWDARRVILQTIRNRFPKISAARKQAANKVLIPLGVKQVAEIADRYQTDGTIGLPGGKDTGLVSVNLPIPDILSNRAKYDLASVNNSSVSYDFGHNISLSARDATKLQAGGLVTFCGSGLDKTSGSTFCRQVYDHAGTTLQALLNDAVNKHPQVLQSLENRHNPIPYGSVILTDAPNMSFTKILHTVLPRKLDQVDAFDSYTTDIDHIPQYLKSKCVPETLYRLVLLHQCYKNCLELAQSIGLQSLVLPCIGTGSKFGIEDSVAASVAISTVRDWMYSKLVPVEGSTMGNMEFKNPILIVFSVRNGRQHEIYERLLSQYFPAVPVANSSSKVSCVLKGDTNSSFSEKQNNLKKKSKSKKGFVRGFLNSKKNYKPIVIETSNKTVIKSKPKVNDKLSLLKDKLDAVLSEENVEMYEEIEKSSSSETVVVSPEDAALLSMLPLPPTVPPTSK